MTITLEKPFPDKNTGIVIKGNLTGIREKIVGFVHSNVARSAGLFLQCDSPDFIFLEFWTQDKIAMAEVFNRLKNGILPVENFDSLTRLFTLDQPDLCYEFNTLMVLQDKDQNLYYVSDSGCSCPIPFEWCFFNGPNDHNLESISNEDSLQAFIRVVENFPTDHQEKDECIDKVKTILKGRIS